MKRLKLSLENLEVESFTTDGRSLVDRGTVHGQLNRDPGSGECSDSSDTFQLCLGTAACHSEQYTCAVSCNGTCAGGTCYGTCAVQGAYCV
jgi:hypothetical protein